MDWQDFAAARVRIEYADMARINKVRSWARRNGATVNVTRYATNAYEGFVSVPMPQGREQQAAKIEQLRSIIQAR
jgi:hypothetical protein